MDEAESFLKVSKQFKLGMLITEQSNPLTINLSTEVKSDIVGAINSLRKVDQSIIPKIKSVLPQILELRESIKRVFERGNKVFLVGCGATGRLSITLETLYRKKTGLDNVIGFMAGGDSAIISSIEHFEDHPELGEKHLGSLSYGSQDLLIASTEGGETPYVIGAVTHAKSSKEKPYFLYCNPEESLQEIERSHKILKDVGIKKINLASGPQAIAGSTRMQASTILELAIGLALVSDNIYADLDLFEKNLNLDLQGLKEITKTEAEIYKAGEYLLYKTDSNLAVTILTDTTERSPTFSLSPFENWQDKLTKYSLCYLHLKDASDSKAAWETLLGRPPRPLNLKEYPQTSLNWLYGFDFSDNIVELRTNALGEHLQHTLDISYSHGQFLFELNELSYCLNLVGTPSTFIIHLLLKVFLNTHSTLVMGLLGRYEGNLMTFVRPNNYKLIDRAVRYAMELRTREGKESSYSELVKRCFKIKESIDEDTPIVLELVKD